MTDNRRTTTSAPPKPGGTNGGQTQALAAAKGSVAGFFQSASFKKELGKALARHLEPEHFLRTVWTECRKTPKLFECEPASFAQAIMQMAQLGLEPGPLGHAYLLPFKDKDGKLQCTLIVGYKGVIHLAWRSDKLDSLVARVVCENDEFNFAYGTDQHVTHKPDIRNPRGPAIAYYAQAQFKGGGQVFVVMSRSDVERYRLRSKSPDKGPWKDDYDAMACKTAILRLKAFLPLKTEEAAALDKVERIELGIDDDDIIDGTAVSIADITEEQQGWVDKVNAVLPEERRLKPPAQAKLREDGGFEALEAEVVKRAQEAGIDPQTGEKAQETAEEPKDDSQPATAEETPKAAETDGEQKDGEGLPLGQ